MLTSGIMYYVQPLLEEISRTFATTAAAIGSIPSFSQIGYVAGLLLVTPLGDVMDKRRLIIALLALAAKLVQRPIERLGPRRVVRWCAVLMLTSFAVMGMFASQILGLIAGVVLLDLGAQAATVANQTELYQLHSSAHTRLNTIYKMHYFIGGAVGSYASALAWQHAGWDGVCWTGALFLGLAMLMETRTGA